MRVVQEGRGVERYSATELFRAERFLEFPEIAGKERGIEAHVLDPSEDDIGAELLPKRVERLGQAVTSLLRVALGPEIGEQLVASHAARAG